MFDPLGIDLGLDGGLFSFLYLRISSFPFVKDSVFPLMCIFGICQNPYSYCMHKYLGLQFHLIDVSVFYQYNDSPVGQLEIRNGATSNSFFVVVQNYLGCLWSFVLLYGFLRVLVCFFNFYDELHCNIDGDDFESLDYYGR